MLKFISVFFYIISAIKIEKIKDFLDENPKIKWLNLIVVKFLWGHSNGSRDYNEFYFMLFQMAFWIFKISQNGIWNHRSLYSFWSATLNSSPSWAPAPPKPGGELGGTESSETRCVSIQYMSEGTIQPELWYFSCKVSQRHLCQI